MDNYNRQIIILHRFCNALSAGAGAGVEIIQILIDRPVAQTGRELHPEKERKKINGVQ